MRRTVRREVRQHGGLTTAIITGASGDLQVPGRHT
jgi:hypothetical protein